MRKFGEFSFITRYIAVFLEVGHWLAGRFHHLETLIGENFWSLSCPPKQVSCSFTAGARRRTFAQSAAQRFVASISQESVPSPSEHALRHHRLRRFAACCARLTPENMLGRRMLQGRGSGGPKESKWKLNAARAFNTFFGKRTGSPLPAAPPGAPLSEADRAASSSDEELPPPSQRVLKTTPVAWAADGRPTLNVRVEPRSPVPVAGDEDLYEAAPSCATRLHPCI